MQKEGRCMENKIEKLKIYKDAIEGLYNDGYCKGIISKKDN